MRNSMFISIGFFFCFFLFSNTFAALSTQSSSLEEDVLDEQPNVTRHNFERYFDVERDLSFILYDNVNLIVSEPIDNNVWRYLDRIENFRPYLDVPDEEFIERMKIFYQNHAIRFMKICNNRESKIRIKLNDLIKDKVFDHYESNRTSFFLKLFIHGSGVFMSSLGVIIPTACFLNKSMSGRTLEGFFMLSVIIFFISDFFMSVNLDSLESIYNIKKISEYLSNYIWFDRVIEPGDCVYRVLFLKKEFGIGEQFSEHIQEALGQITTIEEWN